MHNNLLIFSIKYYLVTCIMLLGIFAYLYFTEKKSCFKNFILTYFLNVLGIIFIYFNKQEESSIFNLLNHISLIVAAYFFIKGMFNLIDKKINKIVYYLLIFNIVYLIITYILKQDFFIKTILYSISLCLFYFYIGVNVIVELNKRWKWAVITGILLFLLGLHQLDYSFLKEIKQFAIFDFILSELLFILIAIAIIIIYFKSNKIDLNEKEQLYKQILNYTNDAIIILDKHLFVECNDVTCKMFECNKEDIIGKSFIEFMPKLQITGETSKKVFEKLIVNSKKIQNLYIDLLQKTKLGKVFPTEIKISYVKFDGKENILFVVRDTSKIKSVESFLEIASNVFNNSKEGIVITDKNGVINYVNEGLCKMTGYDKEELIGEEAKVFKSYKYDNEYYKDMWNKLIEDKKWSDEIWNRNKNKEPFLVNLNIVGQVDISGNIKSFIAIMSDITEFKVEKEKIKKLKNYDALTGLSNRDYFLLTLKNILGIKKNRDELFLLEMDINDFQYINSIVGYDSGDNILIDYSKILNDCFVNKFAIGRYSGDRFMVLTESLTLNEVISSMNKFYEILKEPFYSDEQSFFLTVATAIYQISSDDNDYENIIKKVESALDQAKEKGKNAYYVYDQESFSKIKTDIILENDLRESILNNEIIPFYQPKLNIRTNKIIGFEALARWIKKDGTFISPAEFIPLAEKSDLIKVLGRAILYQACKDTKKLVELGFDKLRVSVNLSIKQFFQDDIVKFVTDVLDEVKLDPKHLELEITESVFINGTENVLNVMKPLQKLGIKISLDDFGVGFSSLSYIKNIPFDILKIDKTFVDEVPGNKKSVAMLKFIFDMANTIELETIVEGVEEKEQMDFLKETSCFIVQGFYFSKPLKYHDLVDIINKTNG